MTKHGIMMELRIIYLFWGALNLYIYDHKHEEHHKILSVSSLVHPPSNT
jgi:hypothetical protein